MTDTLELPNGEIVIPEDIFLYNGYPYRFVPTDGDGIMLRPLYWGDSEMDIPFRDREALVDQYERTSRGTVTAEEWDNWLEDAYSDERFSDEELAALAEELPAASDATPSDGLLSKVRQTIGL